MDCGKSTLALQVHHDQSRQGRRGLPLTQGDRSTGPRISSRVGLCRTALDVDVGTDLRLLVRDHWAVGHRVDYLIVDQGQVVREGATVVVADTAPTPAPDERDADVDYQVLCRRHHVLGRLGPNPAGPGQLPLP